MLSLESVLNYIVWSPNPAVFSGFERLRWYSLLFALGFIISQQIMIYIYNKEGHDSRLVDKLTIYMVLSTIIGARLGHVLFYEPEKYLSNPIDILKVWEGGLASHGAAIAILIALYMYSRKVPGQSYLWVVDRIVIVTAMVGAMIRIGNLMNSEIGGKPTDNDSGFVFARDAEEILETLRVPVVDVNAYKPSNRDQELKGNGIVPVNFELEIEKGSYEEADLRRTLETDVKYVLTRFRSSQKYLAENPDTPLNYELQDKGDHYLATIYTFGVSRYPTQIYESISYFIIFLILFGTWYRYQSRIPDGLFLGFFLITVFGMRFIWEFLKENQVEFEEGLTLNMGQTLSIPLVIGGLILVGLALKKGFKPLENQGTGS
ncbi:Prolipoprotein diacylglyceryl transferase [Indibacter alkaliphilus LW1]|jgi:phosphatidylglycerol:prolipoprotein diacylglycerol transferase|uniref:Phosphatidylglycerol--prolipoprotein diacylglyceryl transferase n=1 Tax=Indibacter alkaliphilus (strain CCUG 57479 / KCTC 22604 / LW1) TaxID=1189612 RepID=S2DXS7_INDAL|nr:prolipoprotein diacylglyceryl transferase [Indibacter alkaliphilus]EOZ96941.1 Prolipoprotein diacylglyceryl transferase [Indibacter alkaliphilus LW1]